MNAFSKKILSAFIDINEGNKEKTLPLQQIRNPAATNESDLPPAEPDDRFTAHFDKLFTEANLPGPGYHEFSKMVTAMKAIPNEQARYCAAFAGLQVQGLSKEKLLASTRQFLQLLEDDTTTFQQSVPTAFKEKVSSKREAVIKAKDEMQVLSQHIFDLQEKTESLIAEIAENEAKIQSSNSGYNNAMEACKKRLLLHAEKINQYII